MSIRTIETEVILKGYSKTVELKVQQETLTDDSEVFNVKLSLSSNRCIWPSIELANFNCVNLREASSRYDRLKTALDGFEIC